MQWSKQGIQKTQVNHLITANGAHLTELSEIRQAAPVYFQDLFSHDNYWNVCPKLVVKRNSPLQRAVGSQGQCQGGK